MEAVKRFVPTEFQEELEENAEANNIPSIGTPGNYVFPGMQLNIASAVSWEESKGACLAHLLHCVV